LAEFDAALVDVGAASSTNSSPSRLHEFQDELIRLAATKSI
jgi:hypothetical protein